MKHLLPIPFVLGACGLAAVSMVAAAPGTARAQAGVVALAPSSMARIGKVSDRYQSYNIEMLEVTGGKFWRPYGASTKAAPRRVAASAGPSSGPSSGDTPAGMNPDLYEYRPPIDLKNRRLRTLAAALGPAYVRVSGTWANSTYFADSPTPPAQPPQGYDGVLSRQQWLDVIDFSRAVDAPIVTSMPISVGTRGADGVWQPDAARRWLAFTQAHGGTVAAAELFNEPTLAAMGGAPKGYDAAAFGRDFKVFEAFMRSEHPSTRLLAPGSVGESTASWGVASGGYGTQGVLSAQDLTAHTGGADAFSYHHYGAVSQRCAAMGHQTTADQALGEDWLGRTDQTLAAYRAVRDARMPGKPFWNTETADAACGGNPWARTFRDTFRYLDQLGRLARQELEVVMHNTLVASDYGLLDDKSFAPKPNYWGALLWRQLMGADVLDAGVPIRRGMHLYAHCLRGVPGGVALLAINNDEHAAHALSLPTAGLRYTLSAANLDDKHIRLNGKPLRLGRNDAVPNLAGAATPAGVVQLAPATISFLALPTAANDACGA